jgi:hypothetical protein
MADYLDIQLEMWRVAMMDFLSVELLAVELVEKMEL